LQNLTWKLLLGVESLQIFIVIIVGRKVECLRVMQKRLALVASSLFAFLYRGQSLLCVLCADEQNEEWIFAKSEYSII